MTDTDPRDPDQPAPDPEPGIGDVVAILLELAGRVDVLTDQVADLERIGAHLEREDRARRSEQR
jgi:hypothetical protein